MATACPLQKLFFHDELSAKQCWTTPFSAATIGTDYHTCL
jgi:hypothetical protein